MTALTPFHLAFPVDDLAAARDDIDWVIEPRFRLKGETGEPATLFLRDPSGDALEFKAFRDFSQIFAR